ncbi:universal stress protein [Nocardioides sp. cx-169]|uniref:universal stress protein n=1 Tax=Nocardioides sp. cx-169 TaxID=2899080 RepID=UPI001E645848|nr:universal stress protein [Nocardioides sp. cx-169]MCD4535508.1 universal stress protein [Nocardioides sp. cx-169]
MNMSGNRIIVAVASEDVEAMMTFAVDEALRTRSDLHLVHVLYLPGAMLPETYSIAYTSARQYAVTLLEHAEKVATELVTGRVAVTTELVERSGSAVSDLAVRSREARLVVLQHRHLEGLQRFTTTSTTLGVAARAHPPVASVPQGWQPAEPPHGRVTVGVSSPERADAVLRTAFDLAQGRGARLRVLHAWWLASGYDVVVVDDDMRRDFDRRFRSEMAPHLEPLQREFPGVEVETVVVHAPPAVGLVEGAVESDLVVVGRRHWALPVGSHVGAVARAMLRTTVCPVVLVETTGRQETAPA